MMQLQINCAIAHTQIKWMCKQLDINRSWAESMYEMLSTMDMQITQKNQIFIILA